MIEAGIHLSLSMSDYIGDPCPEPSVSTGVIETLTSRSPAHARENHPRLGGREGKQSKRSDLGSGAHSYLLGGPGVTFVDAPNWLKKVNQGERKEIRESGGIPLLLKQKEELEAMSEIARRVLDGLGSGLSESTLIWQESNGVWCRSRPDWIHDNHRVIVDYKTADNADPMTWVKTVLNRSKNDLQAALGLRGLDKIMGHEPREYLWLVQEIEPPYCCSLVGLSTARRHLADQKIATALETWRQCLSSEEWPGYRKGIYYADEIPSWQIYDWEERQEITGAE